MSPILFREYGNDIPSVIGLDYQQWKEEELREMLEYSSNISLLQPWRNRSIISTEIESKNENEKSKEERWDEALRSNENNIEHWRNEKTGIGPEPELRIEEIESTAKASLYADDNSAGEEGTAVEELKAKTEDMLTKIFSHMKTSRLLVNPDKTKIMLPATY